MERIHIAGERINESNPAGCLVFEDVKNRENRELLKRYMKYLIAVSDLSISNIRGKSMYLRNYLKFLDREKLTVGELTREIFEIYINQMLDKDLEPKSFNTELLAVTQFYNFLLVRGEVSHMPYRPNDYIQKNFDIHHDRSVEAGVSEEIILKLRYFPEHLRLMYLHLWGIGLRASEVCTLKGEAYEWDGRDAWIKVWQTKMRKYKRVPIPEMLYRLMKVYIKKYDIGADDYLFPNSKGGAFRYGTLRSQMLQYCEENQIHGGEYIFRSHDYRHNVATEFYDNGVPLSSVRDYHGYTYDEMTLMTGLIANVEGLDFDSLEKEGGIMGIFKKAESKVKKFLMQYEKLEVQVDRIEGKLEEARMEMLKDIGMLDAMYEKNLSYFRQLQLYIAAGEEKLQELREQTLPSLRAEAERSGDSMNAQIVRDFEDTVNQFEKKIHDLKTSRTIAIQTAPQLRLVQNNDKLLADKIQTAIKETILLWKSQMVMALGLYRQQEALKLQRNITDTTNQLLLQNSEKLRQNTLDVARESERSIVDIATLRKANENLISTMSEADPIQQDPSFFWLCLLSSSPPGWRGAAECRWPHGSSGSPGHNTRFSQAVPAPGARW